MRILRGKLGGMTSLFMAGVLLSPLVCIGASAFGQAQDPAPYPGTPLGQSGGRVPFGQGQDTGQNPGIRHAMKEAEKKRSIERQKQMVSDANRIAQLAEELSLQVHADVKGKAATPSTKKAEEIEKLAKGIRERLTLE